MGQEWRDEAMCIDMPVDAFYPIGDKEVALTIELVGRMCPPCPVRAQCYATGMAQRPQERQGWWGGVDVEVEFRRRKRIA